eukprot:evm.model.scf_661.8 EVM.evm.TU.scf_661.8   scf_661:64986-65567(-)
MTENSLTASSVEELLSQGADPNACCIPTEPGQGCHALHATADKNDNSIVARALLKAGANVGATCRGGWTPLHIAAGSNAANTAEVLIFGGADVNARNRFGETPLHWAADRNSVETAALLIRSGADVDARKHDGFTPLHLAAIRGFLEVAELLVASGADKTATNGDGKRPGQIVCADAPGCVGASKSTLESLLR